MGLKNEKSKSPLFPGVEPWLQMTSALQVVYSELFPVVQNRVNYMYTYPILTQTLGLV